MIEKLHGDGLAWRGGSAPEQWCVCRSYGGVSGSSLCTCSIKLESSFWGFVWWCHLLSNLPLRGSLVWMCSGSAREVSLGYFSNSSSAVTVVELYAFVRYTSKNQKAKTEDLTFMPSSPVQV